MKNKIKIAQVFKAKRKRRKNLARLSIEEKLKILVQLQKMAFPLLSARGLKLKPWVF
ncbi:hypothetical protein K1X76_05355 [bacterium]|nr:hypothetical protein [bacterium]